MKRFLFFLGLAAALISTGCTKFYYAKDLKEKKVVEFKWLKEMEDYIFNKKNADDRTPPEDMFYLACYFDAEMQRGGFAMFFKDIASRTTNAEDADRVIGDTIQALKSMNMNDRAGVLEETYNRYQAMNDPDTAAGRKKTDVEKMLEEYSDRYYRLSAEDRYYLEGLIEKTSAYVEQNLDDFYIMR
ncbi:MAG: DUF4375 domain-containing protein [Spirochaetales bacterium]|nr:DUF4375 domain-containing protein [Spirochaetales bacterium]